MEVILRETIDNLGSRGEIVDVKRGYARNFLFTSKGRCLLLIYERYVLILLVVSMITARVLS